MAKNLLIVESPTKAKTIGKYLGRDFHIMASVGHVKDLPNSKLGVDIEQNFQPEYVTIKGKGKILTELKRAGKSAEVVFLGPDPDREGEAIAWHIARELGNGVKKIYRVLFNELTARGIKEAISDPQELNQDRFESQQARRILDRLVGYQISPLLWTKVRRGLSAGRVQSVALRMICDRERSIFAFEPQEYWSLTAHLKSDEPPTFKARLFKYDGEKVDLKNEEQTQAVVTEARDKSFTVDKVTRKKKKRNPLPPFTTSLLQQEAYRKLRFPAKKTMFVAQNLYEGIELGEKGQTGLITYMRTDSFRVSNEAIAEARDFIGSKYGSEYLPKKPNAYKSRKNAQEAHEAIRPTSVSIVPEEIARYLNKDQLALYTLIWKRFLASQMNPAVLDQTQADIKAGKAMFRATGSVVVFKGFTALYEESPGNGAKRANTNGAILPPLQQGQVLEPIELEPAQHFTQPPPRFTEASLIKELEENGIGRPSTYATIMSNIREREYVTAEKGRFRPSELGFLVSDLLVKSFPEIMDIAFTALMENNLDKIERGEIKWDEVLSKFYDSFEKALTSAKSDMRGEIVTDLSCPKCEKLLLIKSGRNGLFLGCSGYPDCKYTANFDRDEKGKVFVESTPDLGETKGTCDKCGKAMVVKRGKFGPFLACSGYPECKNTRTLNNGSKSASTDVSCPQEGCNGKMVERISKKGTRFFACNQYPKCRFVVWSDPINGTCPKCGTKVFVLKQPKGSDPVKACRKKGCGFKSPLPASEEN